MKKIALFIGLFTLANLAYAERYALLVGVSKYKNFPKRLAGAINDVTALNRTLLNYGFNSKNITQLKDEDATRYNIQKALQGFSQKLSHGDYFVFYFSGHGTSRDDDERTNASKLPTQTGALMPYDTKKIGIENLFITCRDLRPYIEKMDKKGVIGLGLIDACFSGNSYRSIGFTPYHYRYNNQVDTSFGRINSPYCNMTQKSENYPYKNFVFMLASGKNEKALDLDGALVSDSYQQVPHGAFTSALLSELNTNNKASDYTILFNKIEDRMNDNPKINHSPLLYPDPEFNLENSLYQKTIFATNQHVKPAIKPRNQVSIEVKVNNSRLNRAVVETAGVSLAKPADLIVTKKQGQYLLTDIHNVPLYTATSLNEMVEVIKQQGWINQLKQFKNNQQPYKLRVSIKDYQGNQAPELLRNEKVCRDKRKRYPILAGNSTGTFVECEIVTVKVVAGKPSYIVAFSFTANGQFKLLYPYKDTEYRRREKKFEFNNLIGPPFGQDMTLALAFNDEDNPLYRQIKAKLKTKSQPIKPKSRLHQQIINTFMQQSNKQAQYLKITISVARH